MYRLAYNPTDSPVLVDAAGRTLGGREWGPVKTTADEVKVAHDAGRLVYVELDAKHRNRVDEAASRAHDRVDELTKRSSAFDAVEKGELEQLVTKHQLRAHPHASKSELVDLLAHSNLDAPAPPAPKPPSKPKRGESDTERESDR